MTDKKHYALPNFPPRAKATFWSLCEAVPESSLAGIFKELDTQVAERREEAKKNQNIDKVLLEKLYERSKLLLKKYPGLKDDKRALIIGAIRYFVIVDDELPESDFAAGFYDDVKVMNFVLQEVGIEDFIENN
jgi:uncharacterized membrane protein YkvA (DUF1232 family)